MPSLRIVSISVIAAFFAVALFSSMPVQSADAASMTFVADTTITTDQTVNESENPYA